jgi:hypothetical protein
MMPPFGCCPDEHGFIANNSIKQTLFKLPCLHPHQPQYSVCNARCRSVTESSMQCGTGCTH